MRTIIIGMSLALAFGSVAHGEEAHAGPRFSAVGGNFLINPSSPHEQQLAQAALRLPSCVATQLPPGAYSSDQVNDILTCPPNDTTDDHAAAALVNWQVQYNVPSSGFDPVRGVFTAPKAGHYVVTAKLGVFTGLQIINQMTVPKLNLIYSTPDGRASVVGASYAKSLILENFTINNGVLTRPIWRFLDVNEFVIITGVAMERGSTLRLYYKEDTGFRTLASSNPLSPFGAWTATPLSVSFEAHWIGKLEDDDNDDGH